MPFVFPLEAVLHFRRSVEHQQERRLRAANQLVARARHLIEQVELGMEQSRREQTAAIRRGTTAAELHFSLHSRAKLTQQRSAMQQELGRLQKLRDELQLIFYRARRERETLQSLRDRQFDEYRRVEARREQRRLDDLFLLRRVHQRRS